VAGLWTSLEPTSATVDPVSSTRVRLRVRSTGDVVDEYRFEPVGPLAPSPPSPLAPWTTIEPASLRLYPGTTGTVELTFAPPRTPDATAAARSARPVTCTTPGGATRTARLHAPGAWAGTLDNTLWLEAVKLTV
jgi:hypothetical protein